MKKLCSFITAVFMIFAVAGSINITAFAAEAPKISTNLLNNSTQRSSKKVFDVWARNASGKKIKATVRFNGQSLNPTWDDNEKACYTLSFSKEGKNTVIVSASSDGKTSELKYTINYKKAAAGEKTGTAIWSIELFSINCGYLINPVKTDIIEGKTAADQLLELLDKNGYTAYYCGNTKQSFYLAYVANGNSTSVNFNGYKKSNSPKNARLLEISPSIPQYLAPQLKNSMTFYDPDDYVKNWSGYLGEFVFTNGSGWMYSVNNIFPNVGFADYYLQDDDVIRVQFTLGYGADIGGFGAMGTKIPGVSKKPSGGYYKTANKDELTKQICRALELRLTSSSAQVQSAYKKAVAAAAALNASQNDVNNAANRLKNALDAGLNGKSNVKNSSSSRQTASANASAVPYEKGSGTTDSPEGKTQNKKNSLTSDSLKSNTQNNSQQSEAGSENNNSKISGNDQSALLNNSPDLKTSSSPETSKKSKTLKKAVFITVVLVLILASAAFIYIKFFYKGKTKNENI